MQQFDSFGRGFFDVMKRFKPSKDTAEILLFFSAIIFTTILVLLMTFKWDITPVSLVEYIIKLF